MSIRIEDFLREYFDLHALQEALRSIGITPPKIKIETNLINSTYVFYDLINMELFIDVTKIPEFWQQLPSFFMGFFGHVSLVNNWAYGDDPEKSILFEKKEAEKFRNECIQRLIELNMNPRT